MPAARIFRFARTSRCASVGSAVMKARAISGVVSPQTSRSVNATCASAGSAGWQQVKTSASRSSGIGGHVLLLGRRARRVAPGARPCCRNVRSRRRRSMARLRAVVTIQAPGLRGTPSRGQRSAAMVNASCTASSARSKSPRTRMRMASARPHSSRYARSSSFSSPLRAPRAAAPRSSRTRRRARGSPDGSPRRGRAAR